MIDGLRMDDFTRSSSNARRQRSVLLVRPITQLGRRILKKKSLEEMVKASLKVILWPAGMLASSPHDILFPNPVHKVRMNLHVKFVSPYQLYQWPTTQSGDSQTDHEVGLDGNFTGNVSSGTQCSSVMTSWSFHTSSTRPCTIRIVSSQTSLLLRFKKPSQWTLRVYCMVVTTYVGESRRCDLSVLLPFFAFRCHNVPTIERERLV